MRSLLAIEEEKKIQLITTARWKVRPLKSFQTSWRLYIILFYCIDLFHSWIERFVFPCLKKKSFHCYAWLRLNGFFKIFEISIDNFTQIVRPIYFHQFTLMKNEEPAQLGYISGYLLMGLFGNFSFTYSVSIYFVLHNSLFVIATKWTARECCTECCIYVGWCMKAGQRHTFKQRRKKAEGKRR